MKQANTTPFWYYVIPPSLLVFITGLVYYPSLYYAFQFDDVANINKHFQIRHDGLRRLFFSGTRWISYWLNSIYYSFSKFEPFWYRVGNVGIHTINGILVFSIFFMGLHRLAKESFFARHATLLSSLTALLFLLHPVQTQTVTYVIQGQLEGLANLCILTMLFLFMLAQKMQKLSVRYFLYGGMLVCAALSCGTKEIAIVGPALIVLFDWFFVAQGDLEKIKERALLHVGLFAVVLGSYVYLLQPRFFMNIFGLQMEAQNNIGNVITEQIGQTITPLSYFISQFKVILHYLLVFLWPFSISVEYDWVLSRSFVAPDSIGPFLVLCALGYIIFRVLKNNPINLFAFGMLWFAISIAPRSTIVPSCELIVDYKTYISSTGWLFIIAAGIIYLLEYASTKVGSWQGEIERHRAQFALLVLLSLPLGFGTVQRNKVWSSGLNFWGDIIKKAPMKARGYNNYGVELSQNCGRYSESIPYFEHAIRLDKYYRDPYNNIAVAYAATQDLDKAIGALRQSLKIHPYYPEAYNNIASFLLEKNDYAQAEKALDAAIKLRPHYGKAHFNRGRMYFNQGKYEESWESFRKCCQEADLDTEVGFGAFGKISMVLKRYDDAIYAYSRVRDCNPRDSEAHFNLANAYFLNKNFDKAAQVYQEIIKQSSYDSRVYFNLAETYYMLENQKMALFYFEKVKAGGGSGASSTPQLYMRIAACHEKLGNPSSARNALVELLALDVPDEIKNKTRTFLAQINQKYKLS